VQYRVDKDGSIYLETEDSITKLPTKSYWVNPDKFPKAKNLQELLVSKGISFPKDAYVEYDDASGLLSMANSNENITKLSLLLDSDFGGTLGSPTNWFSLASGGKISLAATKFAPDFVEGQNPLYGTCKIPTADIVEIRSTPFPAANRTLGSWRLVDAPEPVIPQNGGDSPLLGKPAITFDADLLDGGKFSLSEEKGKIVVLDFWATWCGPCTKALPEVISTVSAFPTDKVELVSVNQGEPPEQITRFLKARGLNVTVALDPEQKTGTSYGIEAIPRTIIISQDGTIVWDQTGYDPDNGETISNEIKKLLLGNNEAQKDDGKPSAP
jgi:thiol-disulfide isomerase/thioredoxin